MIKCLFSDHLAKVKSRKPVECQATHVLFLRVGSLCLSWFLSSPVGEASSVNMDTASSLLHPHCCFCAKVGSTANWQCPCLGDVYNFSQFLSSMLALERFCVCEAVKGMVLGEVNQQGCFSNCLYSLRDAEEDAGVDCVQFTLANLQSGWLCIDFIGLLSYFPIFIFLSRN